MAAAREEAQLSKRALITGITGQDGSYLAELLLEQGYDVVGMVRRSSTINFERITHLMDDVEFAAGDLLDQMSMVEVLQKQLQTLIRLRGSAERGRIEIEYFGKEDLDRISRILLEGP